MTPAGNPKLQLPLQVKVALAAGDPVHVILVAVTPGPNKLATNCAGVAGERVNWAKEPLLTRTSNSRLSMFFFICRSFRKW